jgi:hypothetical protein
MLRVRKDHGILRNINSARLNVDIFALTQFRMVFSYRSFGTIYGSNLKLSSLTAWPLKMGLWDCSETSVTNYQSTLDNIPKERRSHLHGGGSLRPRTDLSFSKSFFGEDSRLPGVFDTCLQLNSYGRFAGAWGHHLRLWAVQEDWWRAFVVM